MSKWVLGILFVPCFACAAGQPAGQKEQNARFDQVFRALDTNRSGKLSKPEVESKAPALSENFDQIDANHDGGLTKSEIKQAIALSSKRQREFSQHLEMADKDKNGKLSRVETKALPNMSEHFDEIDSNHDGELVMKEIADYVRANANKLPEKSVTAASESSAPAQ